MAWRRVAAVGLTVLGVLGSGACGDRVKGTAHISSAQAGGAPAKLPYFDQAELANAFAVMRGWDVCALHDPAAARQALGATDGSIRPEEDLADCLLAVNTGETDTWKFEIKLQELDADADESQPENIGGTQVLKSPGKYTDDCTYQLPFRNVAAIELNVDTSATVEQSRICTVAKQYLTEVLPTWQNPPRVGTGKTTPALRMAGQDPCKGLVPFLDGLAAQAEPEHSSPSAVLSSPYQCKLKAFFLSSGEEKSFEIGFDMTGPPDPSDGEPFRVGGANLTRYSDEDCEYEFGFGNPPLAGSDVYSERVDVIKVSLVDCAEPDDALAKLLGAYQDSLARKLPAAADGAVRLGRLN